MRARAEILIAACALALPLAAHAEARHKAKSAEKHDRHAPVEITSDKLEVFQKENRAVFSGHVVAIQGEVRLKADSMTVHYRSQEEDKSAPKPREPKGGKGSNIEAGSVRQIDADGNVFLSTPQETASGAHGIYDPEKHEIRLNDEVVLTRGQNVLKGKKLTYNFETGKSVLTSTGNGPSGAEEGGNGKGRVRALFVPEDKAKKDTE